MHKKNSAEFDHLMPVQPPTERAFFTYMLQCVDGTFYTGWTTDVSNRLAVHNSAKGAKYTRRRLPVILIGYWRFDSKSEAMRFEHEVKQLSRQEKLKLCSERPN